LFFKRRYSKENSVIRQKWNILAPQNFKHPNFKAGNATDFKYNDEILKYIIKYVRIYTIATKTLLAAQMAVAFYD